LQVSKAQRVFFGIVYQIEAAPKLT
jgi:hypothetical protein